MISRFVFLLLLQTTLAYSSINPRNLIEKARQEKWGEELEWKRILFYTQHTFGDPEGIIDDAAFYLDPEGKTNPEAELFATLEAFFDQDSNAAPDEHALCRYPARKDWLARKIQEINFDWPQPSCPRFERWWKERRYDGISLVFSSFFPNSPPSLFGHTFLRLHRPLDDLHRSDLLDDIVSFAAHTGPDPNPLAYVWKGAFGGYPGRFSLLPYYIKIQEYNNLESRDLWEYQLQVNSEQIRRLVLSLWEYGPHYSDYFYFDENCSYVLLLLLEAADPRWDFRSHMKMWTTPSQSLKAVTLQDSMVKSVRFRPSALSRYEERFDQLNPRESKALKALLDKQKEGLQELSLDLDSDGQKKVLDAALEWIDLKNKINDTPAPRGLASLRNDVLQVRKNLPPSSPLSSLAPPFRDPKLALPESWLMLGGGQGQDDPLVKLSWQPVLQDRLSDDAGYAEGMEIQIMPMAFTYRPQQKSLNLESLSVFRLSSMQASNRLLEPRSWSLRLSYERNSICRSPKKSCTDVFLGGGVGHVVDLSPSPRFHAYLGVLFSGRLGSLATQGRSAYSLLGPELVLSAEWRRIVRFYLNTQFARRWLDKANQDLLLSESGLAFVVSDHFNIRFLYAASQEMKPLSQSALRQAEWTVGSLYFF